MVSSDWKPRVFYSFVVAYICNFYEVSLHFTPKNCTFVGLQPGTFTVYASTNHVCDRGVSGGRMIIENTLLVRLLAIVGDGMLSSRQ